VRRLKPLAPWPGPARDTAAAGDEIGLQLCGDADRIPEVRREAGGDEGDTVASAPHGRAPTIVRFWPNAETGHHRSAYALWL